MQRQAAWGPRQCVAGRHMVCDPGHDCLVRTAACREGHSPKPPVPLRGWGGFGFWTYDLGTQSWTYMRPFESIGTLTHDSRRGVVLGCKDGRVGVYDVHSNTALRRPRPTPAPSGEGAFAYDRAHDLALFVGESGETWTYDIDRNAWTRRQPTRRPKPRSGFAFALDPASGTALFFGGRSGRRRLGDTWTYDVEADRWTRIDCPMRPEARFWSGPGMIFDEVNRAFVLYGGLAQYKRVKARYATGDVWLFKLPPAKKASRRPLPAPDVRIVCRKGAVELAWKRVPGAAGTIIERGAGAPGAVRFQTLTDAPAEATACTDEMVECGTRYEYRIRAVRADGREGPWSRSARTDPAVPGLPVVSVLGKQRVAVTWPASAEPDVVGYRLRRVRVVGEDRFLAEKVIDVGRRTTYRDAPAGLPKRHYQYQVQAVNRLGVASGWSAPAGTIPSAPASLEMTPNAARRTITLRWPANPERGLVGYNIYRWVEPPFRFAFRTEPELITPAWWTFDESTNPTERMKWVKVNDGPIPDTRFVDTDLKRVTTWYYIRAVNVLGVEGHFRTSYSMPVWRWHTDARRFF